MVSTLSSPTLEMSRLAPFEHATEEMNGGI